jgi:hypothetical protein
MTETMSPDAHPFHRHLDECTRCREQPFNLCPEGAAALQAAVAPREGPPKRPRVIDVGDMIRDARRSGERGNVRYRTVAWDPRPRR